MFRMMVTPLRDAAPHLGIGTYYIANQYEAASDEGLVNVTLDAPLILNARQVRMLVQKYGTDSGDAMTAHAGAWTLRREIIQMGHDGIIAVGSSLNEGRLTLVVLGRTQGKPGSSPPDETPRRGAQISRLEFAALRY
jgi:hypothetical protein